MSAGKLARLMIAAPASGAGKTTVTFALLRLLQRKGLTPAAFKCGPDYLDPMFHRAVVGTPCGNLDLYLSDERAVRAALIQRSWGSDIAILEGVMGYYDGLGGTSEQASSYEVARVTKTPVILVLDAHGSSLTLAAIAKGVARFKPEANVQGIILNRCPSTLFGRLAPVLEDSCGLRVLGYLPNNAGFALPSRHLGLVSADEISDLNERVDAAASTLENTLDAEALLCMARSAPRLVGGDFAEAFSFKTEHGGDQGKSGTQEEAGPTIAVARDEAFCFYYEENFEMLRALGAQLVPFSPMRDALLPSGTDALYLGGGYPELHARELSGNASMRESIRAAIRGGMPCVAECGGYLYLMQSLTDEQGGRWPMVGVLKGSSARSAHLEHFGYVEVRAQRDCLYGPAGTTWRAHEFHYWQMERADNSPADLTVRKASGEQAWGDGVATPTLIACFAHAYWPGSPQCAVRFVDAARSFHEIRTRKRQGASV